MQEKTLSLKLFESNQNWKNATQIHVRTTGKRREEGKGGKKITPKYNHKPIKTLVMSLKAVH